LILHDNILYLDNSDLLKAGLSLRTSEKWDYAIVKNPNDKRVTWYAFKNLAPKYQALITATLCANQPPHEYYLKTQIQKWLTPPKYTDKLAITNHNIQMQVPNYTTGEITTKAKEGLPAKAIEKYLVISRWYNLLGNGYKNHKAELKALNINSVEEFRAIAVMVANQQGVKLPSNQVVIRRNLAKYDKQGILALVSDSYGKDNSRKVTEEILQYLIDFYATSTKPDVPDATAFINELASKMQWKGFPVSEPCVYNNLFEVSVQPVWYLGRHGFEAWKEKYQYTMMRYCPSRENILWIGDDTKVNLYYMDGNKKVAKLNVYAILDACSRYWLGWSYAENTKNKDVDSTIVRDAFEMATIRSQGVLPAQMQYDNDTANLYYNRLHTLHFPCMPNNGQSKYIERMFAELQQGFMRKDPAFTGQNIQSKSLQSKINTEAIIPYASKEDAIKAMDYWFEVMNNTPRKNSVSPKEQYCSADNEGLTMITDYDKKELFWEWNKKPITYRKGGLIMEHQGRKIAYEIVHPDGTPNYDWHAENVGRECQVKYNPKDLSQVALHHKDNRFLTMAVNKDKMPSAIYDFKDGDREKIDHRLAGKKYQKALMQEKANMAKTVAQEAEGDLQLGFKGVPKHIHNMAEADMYEEQANRGKQLVLATPTQEPKDMETLRREEARRAD
jgi:hypothetical protein